MIYMQRIPTAPPLEQTPTQTSEAVVLLPFERDGEATEAPLTPTPEPTTAAPEEGATAAASRAEASTPTATLTPEPSAQPTAPATPAKTGTAPAELSIPVIDLVDAPVISIGWEIVRIRGTSQAMWQVPEWRAAGWHKTSAPLGLPGNTVLNGHNTGRGEVFRDLYKVEPGAQIFVTGSDGEVYVYRVREKYILREAGQPISVRQENARYIQETGDERLTLVTCHPYGSLANRLIVIAYPVQDGDPEEKGVS
jgi:LPXTG-site transpeptidase (sortase) family protein